MTPTKLAAKLRRLATRIERDPNPSRKRYARSLMALSPEDTSQWLQEGAMVRVLSNRIRTLDHPDRLVEPGETGRVTKLDRKNPADVLVHRWGNRLTLTVALDAGGTFRLNNIPGNYVNDILELA